MTSSSVEAKMKGKEWRAKILNSVRRHVTFPGCLCGVIIVFGEKSINNRGQVLCAAGK